MHEIDRQSENAVHMAIVKCDKLDVTRKNGNVSVIQPFYCL